MDVDELLAQLDTFLEATRPFQKDITVRPLERRLQTKLRVTWAKQRRAVLAGLKRARTSFDEAIAPDELDRVVEHVRADPTLIAVIEVLGTKAFDANVGHVAAELTIGGAFEGTFPAAADYLRQYGAARVAGIDDITRARLRRLLVDAAEKNWTYAKTAREITTMFDGFGRRAAQGYLRTRAELVAMTEIGDAYEHGGRMLAKELTAQGFNLDKKWITSASDVCPQCTDAAAQGWVGESDGFTNGFSGPLAHPGCRCALARRTKPTITKSRAA
jgi:hypothetical protein